MAEKGKAKEKAPVSTTKLILHFDTRNTLVMCDLLKGTSKEDTLIHLIPKYAWGRVEFDERKNLEYWKLAINQLRIAPPTDIENAEDLINYWDYIESKYPEEVEEENKEKDEQSEIVRTETNKKQQSQKIELIENFTKPGHPGIRLKAEFDRLIKVLTLPRPVLETLRKIKDGDQQEDEALDKIYRELQSNFTEGKFCQIPSFFRMMMSLKKIKREFAVVFRSFKQDQVPIIKEFNYFCAGHHPCYNGKNSMPLAKFDGSKGGWRKLHIDTSNYGYLVRDSDKIQDANLILGTFQRQNNPSITMEEYYAKDMAEGTITCHRGANDIFVKVHECLKENAAFAIMDDQVGYQESNRHGNRSKLFLVDHIDYNTLEIFFDDQVQMDDNKSHVDLRDIIEGDKMPCADALDKFLVKVDPIKAIQDQDYFMKAIEKCENQRKEDIEKIEKALHGRIDEEVDEYQNLKESNDSTYLRKTVFPLLYPALQILEMERPNDPLSFQSLYLLKHKDNVSIPKKKVIIEEPVQNENTQHDQTTEGNINQSGVDGDPNAIKIPGQSQV